jgi:hypothetical protein
LKPSINSFRTKNRSSSYEVIFDGLRRRQGAIRLVGKLRSFSSVHTVGGRRFEADRLMLEAWLVQLTNASSNIYEYDNAQIELDALTTPH